MIMSEDFYGGQNSQRSDRNKKQTEGLIAKFELQPGFNKITQTDIGDRTRRVTLNICGHGMLQVETIEASIYITKETLGNPSRIDLIDVAQITKFRPYIRSPISMDPDEIIVVETTSGKLISRVDGYKLI